MIMRSLAAPNHGVRLLDYYHYPRNLANAPLPAQIAGFCASVQSVGVARTCRLRP